MSLSAFAGASEHYRNASQYFLEQRFDAAIDELKLSLAIDPKQLRATRLLGLCYQLTDRFDQAEESFTKATKLAPKDAEAWFYLGRVYYIRNFFDKGLRALRTAVMYSPQDSRIHECLALTLEATGDATGAEHEYERAIHWNNGSSGTPYLNYGALLLKLNRVPESEKLLLQASTMMRTEWQPHFELGKLYYQTDRFDAALRVLRLALECRPTPDQRARTHRLMANVYARLGRDADARRAAAAAQQ